jgi:putative ABC transport system permease protein
MLSLNVIERVREIGVMRANGATGWTIRCVFGLEGLIMGLLAWVIGFAIAMPLSKVFNQAVGMALVQSPLPNTFSVAGAVIWLFGMFLLATVASWVPTTRAVRLPVREALAYQ